MKKPGMCFLAAAVGLMLVFLIAFQLWRGENRAPIYVSAGTSSSAETEKLNINTATVEQLQTLEGIGPELARLIAEYRREKGGFQSVSELTMIKGIGISLLDEIMDKITVGG